MKWTEIDKKQLKIYAAIAFGIPFLLGLLMWYGSSRGTKYECISECADAVSGGRRHGTVACHKRKRKKYRDAFLFLI